MAQVLVVTSGKGGVGKTTSTAALGAALAHDGAKVVVIDFDVGLRNLDLVLGAERRVVFDLINVINGVAKLPAGPYSRQTLGDFCTCFPGIANARKSGCTRFPQKMASPEL